jgi:hypothetical protein
MGDLAGGAAAILPTVEHRFYPAVMTGPDPDRLRYAQITGAAARHAQAWLTAEQETAAVAELAQAARGSPRTRLTRAPEPTGSGPAVPTVGQPGDVVAVTAVPGECSGVCFGQRCWASAVSSWPAGQGGEEPKGNGVRDLIGYGRAIGGRPPFRSRPQGTTAARGQQCWPLTRRRASEHPARRIRLCRERSHPSRNASSSC